MYLGRSTVVRAEGLIVCLADEAAGQIEAHHRMVPDLFRNPPPYTPSR